MARRFQSCLRITGTLIASLILVSPALAAEGGERLVYVADSRRFTGWRAWIAGVYNESHFYFALLTIVTIPMLGLILGKVTDFLMARLGINLKSRVLSEH